MKNEDEKNSSKMDVKKDGIKAIKWSMIDKFLKRGVQFILSIFLARLLTPSDFGIVAMATIFTSWAEVFSDFGLGQAIIQNRQTTQIQHSTIFYTNLAMGILIGLIFVGISPIAARFYNNPTVGYVVAASSITFFLNSINVVQLSLQCKDLNYRLQALGGFVSSIIAGVIGIILAYNGFKVWSLIIHGICYSLIYSIIIWCKSSWRPSWQYDLKSTKPLLKMGFGYLNQGLITSIFQSLDSMVIGKFYNPSVLGLFNRGKSLAEMPINTIVLPITRPLFPFFASIQSNIKLITSHFLTSTKLLSWSMCLLASVLFASGDELILLLYGSEWSGASIYFKVFLAILPIYPISTTTTSLWKALGRVKLITILTLLNRTLHSVALILVIFGKIDLYLYIFVGITYLHAIFQICISKIKLNLLIYSALTDVFINLTIGLVAVSISWFCLKFMAHGLAFGIIAKTVISSTMYILLSQLFNKHSYLLFKTKLQELIKNR